MNDEDHIKDIIREQGNAIERFGFGRGMGDVWTALYLKGAMTQDQLKEYLGLSTSSISQAIKPMEIMGLIKTIGKDGRKNIYEVEESMHNVKRKALMLKVEYQIQPMLSVLEEKKKIIKRKKTKEKLDKLEKRFKRINMIVKAITALPFWKKEQ